jgi:elongation factor P
MVQSSQLAPGSTVSINGRLYRVESVVKVTVAKGNPFIKVKLRDIESQELIEKNFKPTQDVDEVQLQERKLEFLYPEKKHYVFIDVASLDQIAVPQQIIGNKVNYLKEGVEVKASFYGSQIFALELPQFLELMIVNMVGEKEGKKTQTASRVAQLETGAKVEVPPFIEVGDIIKVDTKIDEYIQRV